jgi:hypothetical protein
MKVSLNVYFVEYKTIAFPKPGRLGFVVDKAALEGISSEYFGFPLPLPIRPTAPHSLIILSSTLYSLETDIVVK